MQHLKIETEQPGTFAKLLNHHARARGSRPAFRHKDFGIWQTWTWSQVNNIVRAYAVGLYELGLKRGDTIAIVGGNRPKLYWTMLAAQALGAIPVPAYADSRADELAYILLHSEAKIAVVQDQEQVDKILAVFGKLRQLQHIVYELPRGLGRYDNVRLRWIDAVIERGERALQDSAVTAWLEAEIAAGKGSDVSVILYTAGTNGQSKGVVLTADRCIKAARGTVVFDKLSDRDEILAYLPPAWVGDHYLSYAQALVAGFCVACPESAETTLVDLREIGPTYYFGPPCVFQALFTRITIGVGDDGSFAHRLFKFSMSVAHRYGEKILNRKSVPIHGRLLYALGNVLIYGPIKNALGLSRVRVAYVVGEAVSAELFSFYRSLGLNLKQLFGQTEAFLCLTVQSDLEATPDTVGRPAPDVDIRIAENGEVLFKSPGMFVSYLKDQKKTIEAITEDGYAKTGDLGFLDAAGHLVIIDRADDVGTLRNGDLFAPKSIENKLKFFPSIKEAVVFGRGREFLTCFVNIESITVRKWAERNNIMYASYRELAGHPLVYSMVEMAIKEVNRSLMRELSSISLQVKRFLILHKELEVDDGELTRTQKIRRAFIAERYKSLIDALYSGVDEADVATDVMFDDGRKGLLKARIRIKTVDSTSSTWAEAAE
jgi:long-chain acyl-CoA synthetase